MPRTTPSRRQVLRTGAAALAGVVAGCNERTPRTATGESTGAGGDTGAPGGSSNPDAGGGGGGVGAELVAEGFVSPVDAAFLADPARRFVVDQPGRVYYHDADGLRDDPYLDLRDRVVDLRGYDERGLLGFAFHPQFAESGRLFVRYSAPRRAGTPSNYDHTFVLSEFRADPGAAMADPDSERVLLEIPEPQSNHNAGSLAFGPDGYLYVGVGDGGNANDVGTGHVDDWYGRNEGGNGQDLTENLLGSVLRIDVDGRDGDRPYAVPDDNPLVGREGLDEQWAWGFRNPWRMSFGPDGRLFVADAGQNRYEEVSVVEKGGNYGWNVKEGTHCFSTASPSSLPSSCPSQTPAGDPLIDPVVEYPHGGGGAVTGIAVVGGYRYGGDAIPAFADNYVFADWRAEGDVFVATPRGGDGLWPVEAVSVDGTPAFGPYVLAFGRDPAGDLYVLTSKQGGVSGSSGALHRFVPGG